MLRHRAPKGGPYFCGEARNASTGWPRSNQWYEWTGEFRRPLMGEFYLSGAEPTAYRAPANLGSAYHIMREVEGPRKEITVGGFKYRLVEE